MEQLILTINQDGKLFIFKNENSQINNLFYHRSWLVAKNLPENLVDTQVDRIKQLSNIYTECKFLHVVYNDRVMNDVNTLKPISIFDKT